MLPQFAFRVDEPSKEKKGNVKRRHATQAQVTYQLAESRGYARGGVHRQPCCVQNRSVNAATWRWVMWRAAATVAATGAASGSCLGAMLPSSGRGCRLPPW